MSKALSDHGVQYIETSLSGKREIAKGVFHANDFSTLQDFAMSNVVSFYVYRVGRALYPQDRDDAVLMR